MNYNFGPYPGMIPMNMMVAQPVVGAVHSGVSLANHVPPPLYPVGYVPPPQPPINVQYKRLDDEKPKSTTTVFVGNILERAPDMMIKIMLQKCGNVVNWKRVQGPTGKLPAFGFCEYDKPESTLRCLRLLDSFAIGEQRLLVKVDQKTTYLLEEYKMKCRANKASSTGDSSSAVQQSTIPTSCRSGEQATKPTESDDDYLDEKTKKYAKEIALPKEDKAKADSKQHVSKSLTQTSPSATVKSDGVAVDEDKKHLVTHAIKQFREQFKDEDERMRQSEIERNNRIAEEMKRGSTSSRSSLAGIARSTGRSTNSPIGYRRVRSPSVQNRSSSITAADDEETREKRRQDRRYREREIQYQTRLESWQARERKRKSFYTAEREKELTKRKEEKRNRRRLAEFLQSYDDEVMDSKYYRGTALARRLKDREREIVLDDRDRQRERDELIEIKRKLLIHHSKENLDELLAKHLANEEERIQKRIETLLRENKDISDKNDVRQVIESSHHEYTDKELDVPTIEESQKYDIDKEDNTKHSSDKIVSSNENTWQPVSIDIPGNIGSNPENSPIRRANTPPTPDASPAAEQPQPSIMSPLPAVSINPLRVAVGKRKPLAAPVSEVFRDDDDVENGNLSSDSQSANRSPTSRRQALLRPLMFDKTPTLPDEKKRAIKMLIESIPTTRSELFAYPIDWAQLDDSMMATRVKPWVNKKIIEYIGEEEPTLTDFICQKINRNVGPEEILEDVRMVLDDEAEVFVVKMWRLIVYETEARRNWLTVAAVASSQ
ncbi:hypothetical protein GJ496_005748 [Pomphorhynchus laevis]|nr:hypothetical protein GJ496_005748 [Pomphorhynchus laevis]